MHLLQALILLGFWLLLSGEVNLQTVAVGAVVAVGTVLVCRTLLPAAADAAHADGAGQGRPAVTIGGGLRVVPLVVLYVVRMVYALVIANIQVAMIVLNPKLPISPEWFHYSPPVRSAWGRTMLANSVTLTPGTLTVELDEAEFLVHALTNESGPALVGWSAERQVVRMEELLHGAPQL